MQNLIELDLELDLSKEWLKLLIKELTSAKVRIPNIF